LVRGPQYGAISKNLDPLNVKNGVSKKHYPGEGKNNEMQYADGKKANLIPDVSCHRVDKNGFKGRQDECVELGVGMKEAHTRDVIKVFKEENHQLKLQNGRLEKLLKVFI
jgi:hypothetical protein